MCERSTDRLRIIQGACLYKAIATKLDAVAKVVRLGHVAIERGGVELEFSA